MKKNYIVEFTVEDDPFDVKTNFYDAKDSSDARKQFRRTVKELGGSMKEVTILSARINNVGRKK